MKKLSVVGIGPGNELYLSISARETLECSDLIIGYKKYELPFNTYSAEELNSLEGDFTKSEFVKSVVEVDNVCERSAVFESNGKLIRRKDT